MGLIDGAQLALFIGPGAQTWDQDAYIQAAQMKLNGVDPEKIRQETGVWWGPDGKPRQEIDDSSAKKTGESGTLGAALDHETLYRAYPDMRNMKETTQRWLWNGLHPARMGGEEELFMNPHALVHHFIHEAQHAIQEREGFASGGMPKDSSFGALVDYEKLMGEAEARMAQGRTVLTPEDRRAMPPEKFYDVPIAELHK